MHKYYPDITSLMYPSRLSNEFINVRNEQKIKILHDSFTLMCAVQHKNPLGMVSSKTKTNNDYKNKTKEDRLKKVNISSQSNQ